MDQPRPPSLTRSAALEPVNLLLLVVGLGLSLTLSNFSLLALAIVLAVEFAYLVLAPRSPAYARRVNLRWAQQLSEQREALILERSSELRKDDRKRFTAINKLFQEVLQLIQQTQSTAGDLLTLDRERLEALREAALEFCVVRQRFREDLSKSQLEQLEGQLEVAPIETEAQRTARGLLAQRVEHLRGMRRQATQIDEQLTVIEHSLALFKTQLSTLQPGAQALPVDVNSLVTEVEATRRTLRELGALEQSIQRSS